MIQVKLFEDGDIDDLQKEVNEWLAENTDIEVLKFSQSESVFYDTTEKDSYGNTTISILYKKDS